MDHLSKQIKNALEIIKRITEEEEFTPSRIVPTEDKSVFISWFGNGKYAEMEIKPDGKIFAWLALEIGTPITMTIAEEVDDSYEFNIIRCISAIQEFIG